MPRNPNPVEEITGIVRLDRALSSWRALIASIDKLSLGDLELCIRGEKKRVGGVRKSVLNKLVGRHATLNKAYLRRVR
jgi:hypothetical protein